MDFESFGIQEPQGLLRDHPKPGDTDRIRCGTLGVERGQSYDIAVLLVTTEKIGPDAVIFNDYLQDRAVV